MIKVYLEENKVKANINDLKAWENNPRYIKEDNFEQLVEDTKGQEIKPMLILDDGTVLGGNMRLRAYKKNGREKVWVTVLSLRDDGTYVTAYVNGEEEETKFESREDAMLHYSTIDNSGYGTNDPDKLAELFYKSGLPIENYLVNMGDPKPISDMMKEYAPEQEIEEDDAPEVNEQEPAKSVLGEVYQLGRHRLMCGDSTKIEDVEKLMGGNKADMVFTDPPYGMFLNADFSGMKNNLDFAKDEGFIGGKKYGNVIGDHEDFNPDFINTIFAMFSYTKEIFMWGANYYSELLQDRNKGSWFVWDKRLDESADKMYGSCFELCWSKNKHKQDIARVKWAGVFGVEQEFDHKRHHPTQKPVNLSSWFIDKFSKVSETIVDLFGGSGSTLIACEQLDRTCYMMELDPKYVDVIRKRYAKFIGRDEEWEVITNAI